MEEEFEFFTDHEIQDLLESPYLHPARPEIKDVSIDFGENTSTYVRPKFFQVLKDYVEEESGVHRSGSEIIEKSDVGISAEKEPERRVLTPFGRAMRAVEDSEIAAVEETGFAGNKYIVSDEDVGLLNDYSEMFYFGRCMSNLEFDRDHRRKVDEVYTQLDPVTRQGIWKDLITDHFMDPQDEHDKSSLQQAREESGSLAYVDSIESYLSKAGLVSSDNILKASEREINLARAAFNYWRTEGNSLTFD